MPVVDNKVAVKRFFQNQAATGLNAMANHTLTVANLDHRSDAEGRSSPAMLRYGESSRDAIRLAWKPSTAVPESRQTQMALTA